MPKKKPPVELDMWGVTVRGELYRSCLGGGVLSDTEKGAKILACRFWAPNVATRRNREDEDVWPTVSKNLHLEVVPVKVSRVR